jgi:hypothetical protein
VAGAVESQLFAKYFSPAGVVDFFILFYLYIYEKQKSLQPFHNFPYLLKGACSASAGENVIPDSLG